jgi:extracellular elastinolytic metalloproteinase
MPPSPPPATRRARLHRRPALVGTALATSTVVALALTSFSSQAAPGPTAATTDPGATQGAPSDKLLRDFDSRQTGAAGRVLARREQALAVDPAPGVTRLRDSLGVQGVVSVDPLTGTPRTVARLDGYLTGPSSRRPADVATDYVAAHPEVFRLDRADLGTLRLR